MTIDFSLFVALYLTHRLLLQNSINKPEKECF